MMSEASDTPQPCGAPPPGPESRRLGVLVGRWLPGEFFLVHHVDVVVGDQKVQAIEIIGEYDPATDSFTGRTYDNWGNVTVMHARVDDDGMWTFTGRSHRPPGPPPPTRAEPCARR